MGVGTAVRSYVYVADLVDAVVLLTNLDLDVPANIGSEEYVSVQDLVGTVIGISGKRLTVRYVPGPVGAQSRNFSNARIYSLGWRPKTSLREGLEVTYWWIERQVREQEAAPTPAAG